MRTKRWMRTGLALLLALVAWFTLCAGKEVAQVKPALTWYGYVKDVIDGHGHFNMTARQTRSRPTSRRR